MAQSENIGVIPYSPLGGGLLTGKYLDEDPAHGRLVESEMYAVRYGADWIPGVVRAFNDFAAAEGYNPVSLAIAWAGGHPAVTAPIIGARNTKQLKSSLEAMNIEMTDDLRQRISALSYEPPPATDRNEEGTDVNYGLR